MQIPEILAPAGDFQSLIAAVENGADAVYLGGKAFSARAFAANFSEEELEKAVEYAHLRNVKIYVTVNILVDNSELKDALSYIKTLYDLGVDGLILQDLGLSYMISQVLPEFVMHGSTQMTVHNREGAEFLAQLGFKRVVLARELSLEDISQINRDPVIELEIFGHGALCVCYSGQCLMSSLIGGRSGNRGRCAQPCRMNYTLVDERGVNVADAVMGEHLLSPRDLNTLELLPEICRAGISSLKFEGRMKRPEYVATVIRVYRNALERVRKNPEKFSVTPEELKELAQIFNRDFTTGYLLGNPGRDLMSFKRPNNRGIRVGRILEIKDRGKMAIIKLDEELRIGDGLEVWLTKGGRQGFFVEKIICGGKSVTEAQAGEIVTINILGKPRAGDRVFKTHDVKLMEKAQNSYVNPQKFVPINFRFTAKEGQPFQLEGEDQEGNKAFFRSDYIVEKAKKHPGDEDYVRQQLGRLGGTSFYLDTLTFDMEDGLMLPASELNAARRHILTEITNKRLIKYAYPEVSWVEVEQKYRSLLPAKKKRQAQKIKLAVRVGSYAGAKAALDAGADVIYLDGEIFQSQRG
ncbi:MAG TPA: U32 family peptidase, partial [Clostridia bacterium]|nr:U32 family peptidase [Clostridia bacterium]